MCSVYIISHVIYHNCSTSILRAHFIHHASNDIVRFSCPTSYINVFHFIYLSYHASYVILEYFRFVNHMLNCTSLVLSYVIAFLMSSIIYQINIILYGSFHTSCITFHIQSYTKYRFISYIYICIISRSFYHMSSHIILAGGSSAVPRTPKTLRFQIWVSLNEALTVPKCLLMEYLLTSVYHCSSLPEKSNISKSI